MAKRYLFCLDLTIQGAAHCAGAWVVEDAADLTTFRREVADAITAALEVADSHGDFAIHLMRLERTEPDQQERD